MSSTPRKRTEDLPQFSVSKVEKKGTHPNGYTDLELTGTFDRVDGVREGQCWLLLPERDCLYGDLTSLNNTSKTAVFRGSEESIPELVDTRLPYLEERWKAVHVWMVVEPEWIWDRVRFEAQDARASRYEAEDVSIIEGQEVKEWIKLERADGRGRTTKYCPVYPVGGADLPLARPDGLIPGGWSHEHCELCRNHIEAGNFGYVDRSEHWVCGACYEKYVIAHDLSFLDDL